MHVHVYIPSCSPGSLLGGEGGSVLFSLTSLEFEFVLEGFSGLS